MTAEQLESLALWLWQRYGGRLKEDNAFNLVVREVLLDEARLVERVVKRIESDV